MKRALLALALCASGCLLADPSADIPCDGDDTCPTGYWCGGFSCASLSKSSPPVLTFVGVGTSAHDLGTDLSAPAHDVSFFTIELRNDGKAEAAYPTVTFDAPSCLSIGPPDRFGILEPGDVSDAEFTIDPDPGCAGGTVTATVILDVAGATQHFSRTSTATFTVEVP